MAECSFVRQRQYSKPPDLSTVNDLLEWNPYPRSRSYVDTWYSDDGCGSVDQELHPRLALELFTTLDESLAIFRAHAASLRHCLAGRKILDAERPAKIHAITPQYWLTRAAYCESVSEQLREHDCSGTSRSVTPDPDQLLLPTQSIMSAHDYRSEVQRAKRSAMDMLQEIKTFPTGSERLQKLNMNESREDASYWEELDEVLYRMNEDLKREWWDSWLRKQEHLVAAARSDWFSNISPNTSSITHKPDLLGGTTRLTAQSNPRP